MQAFQRITPARPSINHALNRRIYAARSKISHFSAPWWMCAGFRRNLENIVSRVIYIATAYQNSTWEFMGAHLAWPRAWERSILSQIFLTFRNHRIPSTRPSLTRIRSAASRGPGLVAAFRWGQNAHCWGGCRRRRPSQGGGRRETKNAAWIDAGWATKNLTDFDFLLLLLLLLLLLGNIQL